MPPRHPLHSICWQRHGPKVEAQVIIHPGQLCCFEQQIAWPQKLREASEEPLGYIAFSNFQPWAKMTCICLTLRTGRGHSDIPAALPASSGIAMPWPDVCRCLPTSAPYLPILQKLLGLFYSSAQLLDWKEFRNCPANTIPMPVCPVGLILQQFMGTRARPGQQHSAVCS